MIEFQDVCASYSPEIPILKHVNFTINDGDFVAFVGTNGAGKSTTMRLMNGLLKPDSGTVLIDGVPSTHLKTSQIARKIGFLFQNPDRQICCNTVRDELLFGFKTLGLVNEETLSRVDEVIESFGFNPDDDPFLLNRGSRQLLALASIIVMDLPVVILDEPTTGLDYRECTKVMNIVRRLHDTGTTIVMVCHDMEVVADYASRVIVMTDGQVIDQGETFSTLRNRESVKAADLIPPQIVAISTGLADRGIVSDRSPVAQANMLDQMVVAVEAMLGKTGER